MAAAIRVLRHRLRLETLWLLPRRHAIRVNELDYQPGLRARVYQPRGIAPFAAVLDVHGGNWTSGDRFQNELLDRALAANGVLVAAIDYRLAPPYAYPASVEDVRTGARWLHQRFNCPVGAIGSSAGGHLAILAALKPRDAPLDFVAADAPATDIADYVRGQPEPHPYWSSTTSVAEGSPLAVLDRADADALPPLLIVHGSADPAVPLATSQRFVERYQAVGGRAEMCVFDGLGHAFVLTHPRSRAARQMAALVLAFIQRQSGQSTLDG